MASSWCLLPLKNCRFSLCFIRNLKIDYMYFFYFLSFIFSKFSKSKKDLKRIWKPIDFRLLWYHISLISLKFSFRFNSFVWFYLKLGYKDVIETYFDCVKTFIWKILNLFFFLFHEIYLIFWEVLIFYDRVQKLRFQYLTYIKLNIQSQKNWRFTMLLHVPCISTTKMFWWIFVLQFTYTGMGNEIF